MDQINPEVKKRFDDLVEETRKEAIDIIKIKMPKKIIALNDLSKDIIVCLEPNNGQVETRGAVIPPNELICEQLEKIKSELWDMINYILTVKFYISLNLPRKEDGNNFGVEVQSEIITNLSDSLDSARQVLSEMITYFATRASYIVNVYLRCMDQFQSRQNPHIADYMNGVATYDNKELLLLSQAVIDIRNTYATLYDRIMKNYDKIMNPCGVHTGVKWDTMY